MTGATLFLDLLRANGVEFVFGNPGTTELPLVDAFAAETGIRYILGLNEVVVLGMADGYAQATGRLAVANLHAAPGLGNAMGMLYNAAKAGAPILVTAGQQDTTIALTEPLLWADLATLARPLVKWSTEVTRVADLPRTVHRAAKVALTAPTGPVFVSIPGDVLTAAADDIDAMAPTRIAGRGRGDARAVAAAADLIAAATSPLILAGDAVPRSGAHAAAAALAEAIGAPVYLEGMANTAAFPSDHRLYAGSVARMTPAVRALTDAHDLVISLGADLLTQSQATGVEALAPGKALIHLDDDPWEIGKNFPATVAIVGDAAATVDELTVAVLARMAPATARAERVAADLAATRAALVARAEAESAALPLKPLAVLHAVAGCLPADAIVVEETLSTGMNTVRHLLPAIRPEFVVRHARRRHRRCAAPGDRHQARPPRPPRGRAQRRRQRDVFDPGAVDGGALRPRHRRSHRQQPQLPHPETAHPRARRAERGERHLCRHGPDRPGDRLRRAGRGAGRGRRAGGDAPRPARRPGPRLCRTGAAADRGRNRQRDLTRI